jgi:hypothetical protein
LNLERSISNLSKRLDKIVESKEKEIIVVEEGATIPRDLKLEANFEALGHERVVNYEKKYREMWDKGIINDDNMLSYTSPSLDTSYWDFTQEEKDYYFDEKRFPKDPNYDPVKDPNRKF